VDAHAPRAYAAAADAKLAAAQKAAAAYAQRQGDLGTLRGEQLGLEGEAQANVCVDCMRMSKFTAVHDWTPIRTCV
jgi:hypothetical protein